MPRYRSLLALSSSAKLLMSVSVGVSPHGPAKCYRIGRPLKSAPNADIECASEYIIVNRTGII
jgi:hypothetical protein